MVAINYKLTRQTRDKIAELSVGAGLPGYYCKMGEN